MFVTFRAATRQTALRTLPRTVLPSTTARRWLTDEARAQISQAVKAHPLVLFMKGVPEAPQCGFSRTVAKLLEMYEVPPEKVKTYNVLEDPELRTAIKEFSDWPTVPQLYVDGEFVGGCDIVLEMHKNGQLEELLENSGIIPKISEEDLKAASAGSQQSS